MALSGLHVRIGTPADYQPQATVLSRAVEIASETGGSITIMEDPAEAVAGADVVATDTWVSMGFEKEKESRQGSTSPFAAYAVSAELLAKAKPDAIFLHCLPAYRGFEVDASVIDGPQSVVWDESENRLHAQKAVLSWLVEKSGGERR